MYKRHVAGPSRTFDHLYDPNFVTSSSKNMWQANSVALTNSAKIYILPVYKTMFTDIPRRPRNMYVLQRNPLPFYSFYDGGEPIQTTKQVLDMGAERSKFCFVPLEKPQLPPGPPTTTQDLPKPNEIKNGDDHISDVIADKCRDIGCQTLFRESSAQTQPWIPNAVIRDGDETPEIVYVADLIKNNCYPGQLEADIVERARNRREFEKILPEFKTKKKTTKKKTGNVDTFEWQNYIAREDELQDCQRIRLAMVEQMIDKREKRIRAMAEAKIENYKNRVAIENEKQLRKLKNEYQKNMRQLEMTHKNITKKYKPKNITNEHIDRASDLYGPQMRFGEHPRQKHFDMYKTTIEPKINGLEEYATIPDLDTLLNPKPKLWDPKQEQKEVERGLWSDKFLAELYDSLKEFRTETKRKKSSKKVPKCLKPIQKTTSVQHPPSWSEVIDGEDNEDDIIYLQKTIKGRAIQDIIYRGRYKSQSLMDVIQTPNESTSEISRQISRYDELSQRNTVERLLEPTDKLLEQETSGSCISFVIEILDKELIRLWQLQNSNVVEQNQPDGPECFTQPETFQETFKNLIKSTSETIVDYMKNMIVDTEDESIEQIKELAQEIVKKCSESIGMSNLNCMQNLIQECLLPEVFKMLMSQEKAKKQQQHLSAAQNALYENSKGKPPQTGVFDVSTKHKENDHENKILDNAAETDDIQEFVEEIQNQLLDEIFGPDTESRIREIDQ